MNMTLDKLLQSNHDIQAEELIAKVPNVSVPWFLISSYAYYCLDKSILSDEYYDQLSKFIAENWNTIVHRHKYLIDYNSLSAGTAFYLKEKDYPTICRSAALTLLKELE